MNEQRMSNFLYFAGMLSKSVPPDKTVTTYHFGKPDREQDKTTQWLSKNIREPRRLRGDVVWRCVLFRRFNYIPTGERLLRNGLFERWDSQRAKRVLSARRDYGKGIDESATNQYFTRAYRITSERDIPKLDSILRLLDRQYMLKDNVLVRLEACNSLQAAHDILVGPFYLGLQPWIVVCDLVETYLLERAADVRDYTWLSDSAKSTLSLLELPINCEGVQQVRAVLNDSMNVDMRCYNVERLLANFDVYWKIFNGERGKVRYRGT